MGHPCIYNIVQLKEDGVPEAESFLMQHKLEAQLLNILLVVKLFPISLPVLARTTAAPPISRHSQAATPPLSRAGPFAWL
jgi:hypothetical protein